LCLIARVDYLLIGDASASLILNDDTGVLKAEVFRNAIRPLTL